MIEKSRTVLFIMFLFVAVLTFSIISCGKDKKEDKKAHEVNVFVSFVLGNVTVAYQGVPQVQLNIKDKIKAGGIIESAANSFANIQIDETGIIRINEKSKLEIDDILSPENGTELDLKTGSVFSKIMKNPDMKFRISMPTMVAAIRGTEFLTIAESKRGQVLVKEGIVNVSTNSNPEGKSVTEKKRIIVDAKGETRLVFQNKLQELTLEKYSLDPYIERIDEKSREEIQEIYKSRDPEKKEIDIKIETVKEEMLPPLDRLRKQGKPLVELYLKDGSQIIGSINKTTETDISLDTGESIIDIPKADIKRRVSVK